MPENILITFLGTTDYSEVNYKYKNKISFKTKYIQEFIVKKVLNHITLDKIIVCLTKEAETENWTGEDKLKEKLQNYNIKKIYVSIDPGEMWQTIYKLSDEIKDSSNIYIDITHSFRFMPMFIMTFVEYIKAIKSNVNIKNIFYGKFTNNSGSELLELKHLELINKCSNAVYIFSKYGIEKELDNYVENILNIIKTKIKEEEKYDTIKSALTNLTHYLKQVIINIRLSRGREIYCIENVIHSEEYKKEKKKLLTIPNDLFIVYEFINKSCQIIDRILQANKTVRAIKAAKIALEFELYQQAITLLLEGILTYLVDNVTFKNIHNGRHETKTALSILYNLLYNLPELENINLNTIDGIVRDFVAQQNKNEKKIENEIRNIAIKIGELILRKYNKNTFENFIKNFKKLSKLRNDINHGGFNKDSVPSDELITELTELIEFYNKVLI